MNILFVTSGYFPSVGGVEKVSARLASELIHCGNKVEVITRRDPLSLAAHEIVNDIPVHRLPFYVYRDSIKSFAGCFVGVPYACVRLLDLAIHRRPCVIHVHFIYSNAFGVYLIHSALKYLGIPIVITFHGSDALGYPQLQLKKRASEVKMLNLIASRLIYHASAITCVSQFSKHKLLQRFPSLKVPISVINNGVDIEFFRPKSSVKEKNIILTIGHLVYEKGFDILLNAFAIVKEKYPNWKLIFAGEGELLFFLKHLARDLGIADSTFFLGVMQKVDLIQAVRHSALVVMSSRWEGFSLAALEAMSCEKAVIMTDFPSAREMIIDGINGIIVPKEDPKAMAKAVTKLIEQPGLRRQLGKAARQEILKRGLTWRLITKEYIKIYQRVSFLDTLDKANAQNLDC